MWIYGQSSGVFESPTQTIEGVGYSGYPPHVNDSAAEGLVNQGPIPCGNYTFLSPRDTPLHGAFVLPLLPDAATRARITAMGRDADSFLCHGDSVDEPGSASRGCLILPRDIREAIWNSTDHALSVVAQ